MYVARKTNGMAVASLVLGICWIWGLGSLLAVIFGAIARKQIRENAEEWTGKGMANWGYWLGIVGVSVIAAVVVIAFIVGASDPGSTGYTY
jgi:hypothetical protein